MVAALRGYPGLVVQSNVDDADHADAFRAAALVIAATGAVWAIITAGAFGAVALSKSERLSVPAFRAAVRHTHCAGAAFSGGLLYGLLHGWVMTDSLSLACASGALRCERGPDEPMATLADLHVVMGSRERVSGRGRLRG
jgi:fructose-1-phosphate kinase PfkB-like protein